MSAFATKDDLAGRLRRTFNAEETTWIEELLKDATSHLQGEIGQKVFPRQTSTYTAYPTSGREELPQIPVVQVVSVTRNGDPIPFTYRPEHVLVDGDEPIDITFEWGYADPPRELTRVTCVLVSQTLLPLEAELGLTVGGLSSAQIDEFRLAWADGGDRSGMELPPRLLASLCAQYGRGGVHVQDTER